MSQLEDTLAQVLADPKAMEQIMALAQSLGGEKPSEPPPEKAPDPAPSLSPQDLNMMRRMANMTGGTDQKERALLRALSPYISRERSRKLEKAMRAAKMASFASGLLSARNGR